MSCTDKVILLVDMDCFYCQVEEKLNPALRGKPLAVVQYNAWRGGGIIAVNYPARNRGVTRHMRGDEARKKCPEIVLVSVPTVREKADLTKYRDAGKSVAKVLQVFTPLIERASVDEAYLDITDAVIKRMDSTGNKQIKPGDIKNTYVVGCDTMDFLYNLYEGGLHLEGNLKLAYGALITEEIRAAVYEQTGYTCSAGIAHNKILAKLACGFNKPNKQTVLPQDNVEEMYKTLPVQKIRSLGGKFGHSLSEDLGITYMSELLKFSEKDLQKRYDDKTALWLYNIARGINRDPVIVRLVSKSIGCCKKFPGKSALMETSSVLHWLNELALEIVERLEQDSEENNRRAKQMVVSFSQEMNGVDVAGSRAHPLSSYDPTKIANDAFDVIKKNCSKPAGTFCLKFLGISAGKFEDYRNVNAITSFFKVVPDNSGNRTASINCSGNNEKFGQIVANVKDSGNYSDTTEELDEDNSTPLIFYGENQTVNEEEQSNSDGDSICNELPNEKKGSFFLKYFENLQRQTEQVAVPRDFDTSLALEELDSRQSEPELDTVDSSAGPSHLTMQLEEICKECGKKIDKSQMTSHMDYHFALQIVREESKLYKTESKQTVKVKSQKRKFKDVEQNRATLMAFLKPAPSEIIEDGQLCPHCNKQIEPQHFQSHLDYHMAKKLHMEINLVKSSEIKDCKQTTVKTKAKNKQMKNNTASVGAFFKKL